MLVGRPQAEGGHSARRMALGTSVEPAGAALAMTWIVKARRSGITWQGDRNQRAPY
jgi:hypothetical protein